MIAPPMRRWQNLLALLAVLLASGALLPIAPNLRFACIGSAIGVIAAVMLMRLRAHRPTTRSSGPDVYDRIAKIRADREKRRRG
ncbi:MAG: hypothetical protein ABR975_03440 [Vulcanimicrobiaceae bacterium]|jgi:hypothetical protein